MQNKIIVEEKFNKFRLDVFLAENTDMTRSFIQKIIKEDLVFVNGKSADKKTVVKTFDEICYQVPEVKTLDLEPKDIPVEIVYQDDDLAVINKPQGLTVHAGNGTKGYTLVNALLFKLDKLSGINGVVRPGIVHRIDKNTSGLLVVAKNDKAHLSLAKQIEEKSAKRTYVALLEGVLKENSGVIETEIGRSSKDRTKMAVVKVGRKAITNFEVIKRYQNYTLCKFMLQTGRTHQIRVHAKYIGHPVVGDKEYGYKNQKFNLEGQLLHACKLEFVHPTTSKKMAFEAPMPDYFKNVLSKIK
ncbi:MAG: RluA family pseudouridine synthase [Clostridiales bacterium]|nr:RluA family pseudouridine synthase [Clostridiales bacterium]